MAFLKDYAEAVRQGEAGADFSQRFRLKADIGPLNQYQYLAANYPPFSLAVPDVVRAQIFLKDCKVGTKPGGAAATDGPHGWQFTGTGNTKGLRGG